MDPNLSLVPLAGTLVPVLILLAIGLPIVGIYVANRYFALRSKELELEAQHHAHEHEARLRGLELRQAAMESALGSLAGLRRGDLLEPPPVAGELESGRSAQQPGSTRTRGP